MEQLSPQLMHKLVFTVLMHGLNDSQTPVAQKVLTDALGHPNPQVRELAVVALADLPVPAGVRVAALVPGLSDPIARVRRRAARALGDLGADALAALPQLVSGLRDADPSVRRDCAGACGRLGPAAGAAAARLTALLAEPETRTRAVIAVALKRLGAAGVPALRTGAESADPELRGRCVALLAELAPGDPLAAARTDDPAESAARADEALRHVQTPPPVAVPRLRSGIGVGDIDALADVVLID